MLFQKTLLDSCARKSFAFPTKSSTNVRVAIQLKVPQVPPLLLSEPVLRADQDIQLLINPLALRQHDAGIDKVSLQLSVRLLPLVPRWFPGLMSPLHHLTLRINYADRLHNSKLWILTSNSHAMLHLRVVTVPVIVPQTTTVTSQHTHFRHYIDVLLQKNCFTVLVHMSVLEYFISARLQDLGIFLLEDYPESTRNFNCHILEDFLPLVLHATDHEST